MEHAAREKQQQPTRSGRVGTTAKHCTGDDLRQSEVRLVPRPEGQCDVHTKATKLDKEDAAQKKK